MNDSERILGRLEEFKDHALRRLDTIEGKVDELQNFKWRLAGGAAVVGIIISAVIQMAAGRFSRPSGGQDAASNSAVSRR